MAMNTNLSREELAELTFTIGAGQVVAPRTEVREYNFACPSRLSRGNLRALQMAYSSLDASWSSSLSSTLKSKASVQVNPNYETTCAAYVESMQSASVVFEIASGTTPVVMLIDIASPLAKSLADRMTGGTGRGGGHTHGVSPVEIGVLKCLMNHLLADMDKAWEPIAQMDFRIAAVHPSGYTGDLADDETLVVVGMIWNTGVAEGAVNIAIPVSSIDSMLGSLDPQCWMKSGEPATAVSRESISNLLEAVSIPVSVELGRTRVSMRDILSMEAGDIVRLETKANDPLQVKIGKKIRFEARPGLVGKRLAAQIEENLENDTDA